MITIRAYSRTLEHPPIVICTVLPYYVSIVYKPGARPTHKIKLFLQNAHPRAGESEMINYHTSLYSRTLKHTADRYLYCTTVLR